jgi:RNA polymerase nonessential primary-like sigma factor
VVADCIAGATLRTVSLAAPTGEDEMTTLETLMVSSESMPHQVIEQREQQELLQDLLAVLSSEERTVLDLRIGLSSTRAKTIAETADILNCSKAEVKKRYQTAIQKLRLQCARSSQFALLREFR